MGVSRDTLDRIKSRLDTLEIIREAVPSLKQSGPRWKGNCPFHNEKTPSFFYMPDKGLWHCFGACNEGGDVFRFVMKTQNLLFPEAYKEYGTIVTEGAILVLQCSVSDKNDKKSIIIDKVKVLV
jgi:DNA primase